MQQTSKRWSIKSLEAKAISVSLKSIVDTCNQRGILVKVESDAMLVVNALNDISEDLSDMKSIIDTIIGLAATMKSVIFRHGRGELNTVAHYMLLNILA